jgi:hypothetical protein
MKYKRIVLGIVRVLYLNRHETWDRALFALSSHKGLEELSHNVKKFSCFADTADNASTDSLYNMVMRGDLHDETVASEDCLLSLNRQAPVP